MNIHEYQGKQLLRDFGVPVPRGRMVTQAAEAQKAAEELGTPVVVVKSQIHAGGRGAGAIVSNEAEAAEVFRAHLQREGLPKHDKPHGVQLAKSSEEAAGIAETLLGGLLVTKQTGAAGKRVHRVLVEEGCDIAEELYLSILLDRESGRVTMLASTEGGMEIEKVAEETPEKIFKAQIDPAVGLRDFQARAVAFSLGVGAAGVAEAVGVLKSLFRAYQQLDASLLEINPLVLTGEGKLVALDAKLSFDDNAAFRQPAMKEMRDPAEEDPRERQADEYDLSYIALDGNIGCMVNGAGLAMATMDIIHHHGGEPANFLDVGGGADADKVAAAFKIILQDESVKAVFINIFGGIMQCDVLATGVVSAARQVELSVPLIVRLEGTNVEEGRRILQESGIAVITAADMTDGARKAVEAAGLRGGQR